MSPPQAPGTDPTAPELQAPGDAPGRIVHNASRRSIVRNALVGYAALAVSLLSGFFATPIVLDSLGEAQFGTYALVGGLVGYLAIADVGVGTATTNRIARLQAVQDVLGLRTLLATSFWIFCAAGLVGAVTASLLALQLADWFTLPPNLVKDARSALLVLALAQSLTVPLSLYAQVLVGAGRADITSTRTMIFTTIGSIGQICVALTGGGIVALALVSATTGLLGVAFLRAQVRRLFPEARINPRTGSRPQARDLLRTGSRNVVISIAGMVSFTSDVTILAAIAPISTVAGYVVAARLVSYVSMLSTRLTDVLMPVYAHGEALGAQDAQRKTAVATTAVSLALALPMTMCCVALGGELLRAWLGDVPEGAPLVLVVLALASLARLPGHSCFVLLTATERTRALLWISVAAAAVNLLLSIMLTHAFGIVGPALGSLAVVLVVDLAVLPLLVCREFGWSLRRISAETLQPLMWPTVAGSLVAVVCASLPSLVALQVLGECALVCSAFLATAYWTALTPRHRASIRRRIRRRAIKDRP